MKQDKKSKRIELDLNFASESKIRQIKNMISDKFFLENLWGYPNNKFDRCPGQYKMVVETDADPARGTSHRYNIEAIGKFMEAVNKGLLVEGIANDPEKASEYVINNFKVLAKGEVPEPVLSQTQNHDKGTNYVSGVLKPDPKPIRIELDLNFASQSKIRQIKNMISDKFFLENLWGYPNNKFDRCPGQYKMVVETDADPARGTSHRYNIEAIGKFMEAVNKGLLVEGIENDPEKASEYVINNFKVLAKGEVPEPVLSQAQNHDKGTNYVSGVLKPDQNPETNYLIGELQPDAQKQPQTNTNKQPENLEEKSEKNFGDKLRSLREKFKKIISGEEKITPSADSSKKKSENIQRSK